MDCRPDAWADDGRYRLHDGPDEGQPRAIVKQPGQLRGGKQNGAVRGDVSTAGES